MGKKAFNGNVTNMIIISAIIFLVIVALAFVFIPKEDKEKNENIQNESIQENTANEETIPKIPEDIAENENSDELCEVNSLKFGSDSFSDIAVLHLNFEESNEDLSENKKAVSCLRTSCPTKDSDGNRNFYTFDGSDYLQYNSLMGELAEFTLIGFGKLKSPDKMGAELISIGDYTSIIVDSKGNLSGNYHYNGGWLYTNYPSNYSDDSWHQFAYVFKNKEFQKLYVDGNLVSETKHTKPIYYSGLSSMNTFVGKNGNGNTNFDFNGSIDNIMIFEKALYDSEIKQLYNCYS